MAVGRSVFVTLLWIGRFVELMRGDMELIPRRSAKMFLCNSMKAKDANIRQALIDRLGEQGTKKKQGGTYGVKSHIWSALAIAVTAQNLQEMK